MPAAPASIYTRNLLNKLFSQMALFKNDEAKSSVMLPKAEVLSFSPIAPKLGQLSLPWNFIICGNLFYRGTVNRNDAHAL